jgi:hypothetical protein
VRAGNGGRGLITFHPGGKQDFVNRLHTEPWLDFTMIQSGHTYTGLDNYARITELYSHSPAKPVMDAEPCYELFWVMTNAWRRFNRFRYDDFQPRRAAWWSVLAGACGYTFGNDSVWQFSQPSLPSKNLATTPWYDAIHLPGSGQPQHLIALLKKHDLFPLVPAADIVLEQPADEFEHIGAARSTDRQRAVAYTPIGEPFRLDLSGLSGESLRAVWIDPRTGKTTPPVELARGADVRFTPPVAGEDWTLLVEVTARGNRRPPGIPPS